MTAEDISGDALGLIGTTVAEKYAIEAVVGQGGFATVYRATHVLWKRTVAVKVFTALGEVAKEQRQRLLDDFIREGALLADLSERSTAICQARDVGSFATASGDTVPYMVLEWLEGRTLEALLEDERARGAPLRSLEATVRFLEPIAVALALAHKKGIAHRDVKPANVFVLDDPSGGASDEPPALKLLDFGIAKVVQDVQRMGFGKTAGHITSFTPLYGAPEQFDRNVGATGPWTDVFALALILTEVVAGREPMQGDSLVQLAVAASDPNRRPTPRTLGVAISNEAEAVFQKAVAVRPSDRYATVGEFWAALRANVLGEFTGAPMSSARFTLDSVSKVPSSKKEEAAAFLATAMSPESLRAATSSANLPAVSSEGARAATSSANLPAAPPESVRAAVPSSDGRAADLARSVPIAEPASSKSKAPIVVGAVAVLALVGVGSVFALNKGGDPPGPSPVASSSPAATPTPTPSPSPAASAAPPPTCPSGMIRVPGGEFFMGSDERDALDMEKPAHRVKLGSYCMDEFEVSVAKYKKCSDEGKCRRASRENGWPGIKAIQRKIYDPLCNIREPEAKATHPINCVDWDQAREFCEAQGTRLPTEAEWEFAARGPDGRIYPWGDEPPSKNHLNACGKECVAWQKAHPDPDAYVGTMYDEDDGYPNTAPTGSFPQGKSRYGIQDVVGNVWEWVADYHAAYPPTTASVAVDPKGPSEGEERVIRGGAWNGAMPSWVRPSFRYHAPPSERTYGVGFRCAASLEGGEPPP